MKKYIAALFCALFLFSFTACNDDDDDKSEWRDNNEKFYKKLADDDRYSIVSLVGFPNSVYYRVIKSAAQETIPKPYQTSTVKLLYCGYLYEGTYFDTGTKRSEDLHNKEPDKYPEPTPVSFHLQSVIKGFSAAVQNMNIGDRWEIWIPWPLGYGSTTTGTIPAYSTLGFEIELVEIVNQ